MPTTIKKPKKTKKTATKEKTMTKSHSHSHVSETSTDKESTMPKINHTETSSPAHVTSPETASTAAPAGSSTPSTAPPASPLPAVSTTTAAKFLAPPPAPDAAFTPPKGFVPDNAMDFRGVLPRTSELLALPIAVADLGKFADYASVMGSKAPLFEQLRSAFTITNDWSAARTDADAWDKYARIQEGVAWTMLRRIMSRAGPAFLLAVQADPSLSTTYPGLTTLLDAKKTIAHKAVSTKKANKKAVSEGKPATHGKVGKKATKAAQKAALAEKEEAQPSPAPAATTTAPAAVQSTPVTATVQLASVPVIQTAPVSGAQSNGAAPAAAVVPSPAAPSGALNGSGSSH